MTRGGGGIVRKPWRNGNGGGGASGFGSRGQRTPKQSADAKAAALVLLTSFGPGFLEGGSGECIVAFTDGACRGNPGPAGSGVHIVYGYDGLRGLDAEGRPVKPPRRTEDAFRSLGRATNNVGELVAVDMALDMALRDLRPDPTQYHPGIYALEILTDSRYVEGVLVGGNRATANAELVERIRSKIRSFPARHVRIHWVAGHTGLPGNERADALAQRGVQGNAVAAAVGKT